MNLQTSLSKKHGLMSMLAICMIGLVWSAFAGAPVEAQRYQRELTRNAHAVWGLDAPVAIFAAQIHQESRWHTGAKSPVGAQGMAQFMPATASWISTTYKLDGNQPNNPTWAMRALVVYDRHLWDRIHVTSICDRMAMTLSSYNGGLGWVYRDQKLAQSNGADPQRWFSSVEKFNAGRSTSAFTENRSYPRIILLKWQPVYTSWGGSVKC